MGFGLRTLEVPERWDEELRCTGNRGRRWDSPEKSPQWDKRDYFTEVCPAALARGADEERNQGGKGVTWCCPHTLCLVPGLGFLICEADLDSSPICHPRTGGESNAHFCV